MAKKPAKGAQRRFISVPMAPEEFAALEAAAARADRSIAWMARQAIREKLARDERPDGKEAA